jgi:two-component system LytT family sensor kinase
MLTHPRVELSILIEGDQLMFTLSNNKPGTDTLERLPNCKSGIGLKNTAKRLQLLYPDKHHLKIEATDTSFCVELNITLKKVIEPTSETLLSHPSTQPFLDYVNA